MGKLSVVINAQNSEKELPRVLASLKDLADEIIVVDQSSYDKTREIAEKYNAKVFEHKEVPYVEMARNFGIGKATGEWVLILDPDEEILPALASNIKELITNTKADYFRIPRKNIVFGKWLKHSRWWPDMNIRLFRKGYVNWTDKIHVPPETKGEGVDIEANEEMAIIHHHYDSISQFLERMDRYTTQQVNLKLSDNYEFIWKDLISKPSNEFFSRYFFGKGYKDGVHGLALSLLQAFSELVLYLKLWQEQKFITSDPSLQNVIGVINKSQKDLRYWENDALFSETKSLTARIKRKLRI